MRRFRLLFVAVTVLPLFGCSYSVGDACSEDRCGSDMTCRRDFPGGFCTQACTQDGQVAECPEGSLCAQQVSQLMCSAICETQEDCRDGYECNGVANSNVKVCRVKI